MKRNLRSVLIISTVAVLIVGGGLLFSHITNGNKAKALDYATEFEHTDEALALVNTGANVNFHNSDGDTPLHAASASGNDVLVQTLLSHGAQIDALNNFKNTPLDYAAMRGRVSTIKILLANGADPRSTNTFGRTPLQDAQGPLKLRSLTPSQRTDYMQSIALLQQAQAKAVAKK